MKANDYQQRIKACVELIARRLEKNDEIDQYSLRTVLLECTMLLPKFNFYPSEEKIDCCEVAFFSSLIGERWNLQEKAKISFDQMFKYLINHCQGKCSSVTKYVVIITDNWDDNIAKFWQANINKLKASGIIIQVQLMIGKTPNMYEL